MQGGPGDRRKPSEARFGGTTAAPEPDTEDFLFHLYRGSELLQDSRVHEAKEELESALKLQPRDPKGQDLLAVVYFRLGLYPRAIEIYEELVRSFPSDTSLGNNLALCYLKTGQADKARATLEDLVRVQPEHLRGWSYLGLAFERLGDYEKARHAFERGQQHGMARRMNDILGAQNQAPPSPGFNHSERGDVPPPVVENFHELDNGYVSFSTAAPATPAAASYFRAVESPYDPRGSVAPGERTSTPPTARKSVPPPGRASVPPPLSLGAVPGPGTSGARSLRAPTLSEVIRDALVTFPREAGVTPSSGGLMLVRIDESFATRVEALRGFIPGPGGNFVTTTLPRKARGRQLEEPLGGTTAPVVSLGGAGAILLGPRQEQRLWPITLEDESAYVRESVLTGFDGRLSYENGRLAVGEGEAVPMVHLRGRGVFILELSSAVHAMEVTSERPITVRRETILGWSGRLLPHEVSPADAPAAARGLVCFAGDGAVLVVASATGLS